MIRKAVYGIVYVADDLFRSTGFTFIQGLDQPLFTEEFIEFVDCFRNAVRVDKETVSGMQCKFTVFIFGFFKGARAIELVPCLRRAQELKSTQYKVFRYSIVPSSSRLSSKAGIKCFRK